MEEEQEDIDSYCSTVDIDMTLKKNNKNNDKAEEDDGEEEEEEDDDDDLLEKPSPTRVLRKQISVRSEAYFHQTRSFTTFRRECDDFMSSIAEE
mmetsp:Transcript_20999/g.35803  ORF Transcript_20999/g.35803 Transcript_20999/m.35803 type:complete len:94 (-) Transcript_20999:147-428(-)